MSLSQIWNSIPILQDLGVKELPVPFGWFSIFLLACLLLSIPALVVRWLALALIKSIRKSE